METGDGFEGARAAREARDAVVGRPPGSRSAAIQDALRRYLSARTYRDRDPAESVPPRGKKANAKKPAEEPNDE